MNTEKFITSLCKFLVRYHLTFFIQFHHRISDKILLKVQVGKRIDKILCVIHNGNTVIFTERKI